MLIPSTLRRLEDVFRLCLQKTSSRRLGQEQYIRLGHTSSRRLQYVFSVTMFRRPRRLQVVLRDVFKILEDEKLLRWRRVENIFKTSSRPANFNFRKHILIHTSKILKKHANFKILSRDEVFTSLFFLFFLSQDKISGWNFISVKTCKQYETFHHRQGWLMGRVLSRNEISCVNTL